MSRVFKLYWVETPSPEENCFVASTTKRSAELLEENGSGFDLNDCEAHMLLRLDSDWVRTRTPNAFDADGPNAFYVQDEELAELGVEHRVMDGDHVYRIDDFEFRREDALNYVSRLTRRTDAVIRSVSDLLQFLKRDTPGEWIFRGHSNCRWKLEASVHRLIKSADVAVAERQMLEAFKRRGRPYLEKAPSTDWEWLSVAQHFGMPTRLLDWTENPLVALYFVVREPPTNGEDGMLFAYRHNAPEVDTNSNGDPFAIDKLELLRPPHIDQRLIVQQSVFTAEPPTDTESPNSPNLSYRNVSGASFDAIREELLRLGICESALFPGLQTIAAELRDGACRLTEVK